MGRLISIESAGKDRARLTKAVALAVRQLAQQPAPGPEARDLAAFLVLALEAIAATIDESVAAWEKRGYWVKAERFRIEWEWAGQCARQMRAALLENDWQAAARTAAVIAQKVGHVNVPPGHRLGRPWEGAWEIFCKEG